MHRSALCVYIIIALFIATLSACGGSKPAPAPQPVPPPQPPVTPYIGDNDETYVPMNYYY